MLLALVAGLPWALWHYIGWPLPDHVPSRDEVEATLLNPMSEQFLLNTLACLCWISWFFFTLDVARCSIHTAYDVARGIRSEFRPTGPLRGLAAALVGTMVLTLLGNRTSTASPATARVITGDLTQVAATAPLDPGPAQPAATTGWSAPAQPGVVKSTEEVRLPQTAGGTVVYDSLWRVAERMFGDGNRWPELFAQNHDVVQPDGRTLTEPNLVRPGWKITGYIPTPTLPPEQSPQPPNEQQPPTTTAPPTTTTQPAPNATRSHAPYHDTTNRKDEKDNTSQSGLDLWTGAFVSTLLAGVISGAVVSARMWHRRRYRIGSGDRSDLHCPIAPVVRALRAAQESNQTELNKVEVVTPLPLHLTGSGAFESDDEPVPVRIGVRAGREFAFNLAGTRGLGLLGPGATATARAFLLHLLAQHVHEGEYVRVLLPAPDAQLIFDSADIARLPSTVSVVDSFDAALDEMEAELVTRTRHRVNATDPRPFAGRLVLLGSLTAHAERRLQAILDNGSSLNMAGILLGQWCPGATIRVRSDGTVSATSPGLGNSLAGANLFTLPAADATELLAVFGEAEGPSPTVGEVPADVESDEPRSPDDQETTDDPTRLELAESPGLRQDRTSPVSGAARLAIPAGRTPTPEQIANIGVNDGHVTVANDLDMAPDGPPHKESQDAQRVSVPSRPPLTLRVLGRVELVLHDDGAERDLTAALTRKQHEVIVYLALHPNGAHRDAVNDAIWPDSPISRPFNSFHNALSRLRRALQQATDGQISEIIRHSGSRYQLDTSIVTTDYQRFHSAVAAHRSATDSERINALHHAVAFYSGHLAEDVTSYWIESYREAIRRDVLDALGILIRAHGDAEPTAVLALLEKMRTLDRYNEGVYRDIIRTHARLGQHDAIRRTLTLLATALDELGQHPSQDTVNLAEFLQRRCPTSHPPTAGAAAG